MTYSCISFQVKPTVSSTHPWNTVGVNLVNPVKLNTSVLDYYLRQMSDEQLVELKTIYKEDFQLLDFARERRIGSTSITFYPHRMNPYWAPISSTCPVCSPDIDWHFILRFEELDVAHRYMIEQVRFLSINVLML